MKSEINILQKLMLNDCGAGTVSSASKQCAKFKYTVWQDQLSLSKPTAVQIAAVLHVLNSMLSLILQNYEAQTFFQKYHR
jgi:hypothetical protein